MKIGLTRQQKDHTLILETIDAYFQGHLQPSKKDLDKAFHDKAQITGYYLGELDILGKTDYLDAITQEHSGPDNDATLKINMVQMEKTVAQATIETKMLGSHFTSYLSFIKVEDNWQIISGVYQEYHP